MLEQTVQQGSTVVAEGGRRVGANFEPVGVLGSILRRVPLVHPLATERDEFVASFVNSELTYGALKTVVSDKSPYEVLAMRTEGGLFEEFGDEFVVFNFEDVRLSNSSATPDLTRFFLLRVGHCDAVMSTKTTTINW